MQVGDHIPFDIDHVSWIGQSHLASVGRTQDERSSEAVIVALSGSLDVQFGEPARRVQLERADQRLYAAPADSWALAGQSADGVALIVKAGEAGAGWSGPPLVRIESGAIADAHRSTIEDCTVVELPRADGPMGRTHMIRFDERSDLRIRRVYYLTGITPGAQRGGHAHKELYQFVVAASGSFEVMIDDGKRKHSIKLSRPDQALVLVPGIWRVLSGFSPGSVCLVMASLPFSETDYLRRYRDYRRFKSR
jgi:hypothetical protein